MRKKNVLMTPFYSDSVLEMLLDFKAWLSDAYMLMGFPSQTIYVYSNVDGQIGIVTFMAYDLFEPIYVTKITPEIKEDWTRSSFKKRPLKDLFKEYLSIDEKWRGTLEAKSFYRWFGKRTCKFPADVIGKPYDPMKSSAVSVMIDLCVKELEKTDITCWREVMDKWKAKVFEITRRSPSPFFILRDDSNYFFELLKEA